MAYGLDVEAVYYTDENIVDIGVLDTYTINIDLAGEKDFEIKTANYNLPIGGFWYVPDTEYGGVIRGKRTQSENEEATYTGRSWRGILDDHILHVEDRKDVRYLQGNITELVNDLLAENGLDSLFKCNAPRIDESISADVSLISIPRGTTLYGAMWQAARSINFNFIFEYNDKVMYLTPVLADDYSEYMVYSSIGALSFDMQDQAGAINHYIITSVSEQNEKRTIHLFTDGEGAIMPYAKVNDPVQDSDYILDKSQQLLFGVDEIAAYEEVSERVVENYVVVDKAPSNWKREFGNYFYREVEDETEVFLPYEADESISYSLLTSRPADWANNYSNYFDRQLDQQGQYEYVPVTANSTQDIANRKKVKEIPIDWKTDYSQYYYSQESGTGVQYIEYSGVQKTKYTLLTRKPSDWNDNWKSYYRKAVKVTSVIPGGSFNKVGAFYVDIFKAGVGEYKTVDKYTDTRPSWTANRYYVKETYTVAPTFKKNNTYIIPMKEVAPTWTANTFYKENTVWVPPVFVKGKVFKMVLDHYADMITDGLAFLETQVRSKQQKVTMDNFIVNIGDTVGGRDEFTGETIIAEIGNINVEIKNGLVEAEYVIGG